MLDSLRLRRAHRDDGDKKYNEDEELLSFNFEDKNKDCWYRIRRGGRIVYVTEEHGSLSPTTVAPMATESGLDFVNDQSGERHGQFYRLGVCPRRSNSILFFPIVYRIIFFQKTISLYI